VSKQCPTCSNRKESFFADGTICPTCGRRASLFLDDIEYNSGVRFDELESLKTALRIKTEEHDCCAEDNIELRQQLAASQAREQQLREALISAEDYLNGPTAWTQEQTDQLSEKLNIKMYADRERTL